MELLWKKETTELGSVFVDILKNIRKDFTVNSRIVAEEKEFFVKLSHLKSRKSNQLSVEYRQNGNVKFMQHGWIEAIELYNQSLCFAEIGSENVSIAYANRSACFHHMQMYEKCLADVALAKEAKYPDRLMVKLEKRESDCLQILTRVGRSNEFVPKLSFDADANFSGMANVLQIQRNDSFGRYVTATKDIDVGKTVLVEEAFLLSASTEFKRCHTCAKVLMNFIACDLCTDAVFCNSECMMNNNFHKVECKCHGFQLLDLPIQHLLRSIFIALNMFPNIEELMEFVERTTSSGSTKEVPIKICDLKSKYCSILKLNVFMTTLHKSVFLPEVCKLYSSLMSFPSMKELFDSKRKQRFLMHLLGQHICVINSNAFSNHGDQFFTFIIQSYFNHSCIPNLVRFECGNKTICTTTRPVKKGEQLFVFYLGYETKDRQSKAKFLDENFGFLCKCEMCESGYNWNPSMPSDREWHHILIQFRQNEQAIINNQSKELRSELIGACINFLRKYGSASRQFEIGPVEDIFGKLLEIEANGRLLY